MIQFNELDNVNR